MTYDFSTQFSAKAMVRDISPDCTSPDVLSRALAAANVDVEKWNGYVKKNLSVVNVFKMMRMKVSDLTFPEDSTLLPSPPEEEKEVVSPGHDWLVEYETYKAYDREWYPPEDEKEESTEEQFGRWVNQLKRSSWSNMPLMKKLDDSKTTPTEIAECMMEDFTVDLMLRVQDLEALKGVCDEAEKFKGQTKEAFVVLQNAQDVQGDAQNVILGRLIEVETTQKVQGSILEQHGAMLVQHGQNQAAILHIMEKQTANAIEHDNISTTRFGSKKNKGVLKTLKTKLNKMKIANPCRDGEECKHPNCKFFHRKRYDALLTEIQTLEGGVVETSQNLKKSANDLRKTRREQVQADFKLLKSASSSTPAITNVPLQLSQPAPPRQNKKGPSVLSLFT